MILLPTRRRLERRRDKLYALLHTKVTVASVQQVEDILRQIHSINLRLLTYFKYNKEPNEVFVDSEEDNDITEEDTTQGEVTPTEEDIAEIEQQIQEGEIQV